MRRAPALISFSLLAPLSGLGTTRRVSLKTRFGVMKAMTFVIPILRRRRTRTTLLATNQISASHEPRLVHGGEASPPTSRRNRKSVLGLAPRHQTRSCENLEVFRSWPASFL